MAILLYLLFIALLTWGIIHYFQEQLLKASKTEAPYYIKGNPYVILKEDDYLDLNGQAIRYEALVATLKRKEEQG